MAMKFSARITHLIGFIMPATDCRYSIPILRYDPLCSLCPHSLFHGPGHILQYVLGL